MTNLNKFQIEGIRQVDEPVISGAPSIPLGDLAESLDKETPIEGQAIDNDNDNDDDNDNDNDRSDHHCDGTKMAPGSFQLLQL